MAPKRSNIIPDGNFHKQWETRVHTWFNQVARKQRRRRSRVIKALSCTPRLLYGLLRPIVRCPTNRYNKKERLGCGFTLDELKRNMQRLKEYKSKLLLFPKKLSAPKEGDSSADELKLATQARGIILPVKHVARKEKARAMMPEEIDFDVYKHLRPMHADKRLNGICEKKTRKATEDGGMDGTGRRRL